MKRLAPIFFAATIGLARLAAQTPTFVQGMTCPNAGQSSVSGAGDYTCPIGEATLANNLVIVGLIYDNTSAPTVTVTLKAQATNAACSAGTTLDTMTQVVTNTTANGNVQRIYKVATAGGATCIDVHYTAEAGFVAAAYLEMQNANTTASGTALCARPTSTSVATGNITVGAGNLLVQFMFADDTTASGALTAGSGFTFGGTDRNDAEAVQYRLGTGSAINPTITQGTSHQTATCAAGFTSASVGTAPTVAFRVTHFAHGQMPKNAANPFIIQSPCQGTLCVIDFHGGGDTITGVTDSASNSWSCTTASVSGFNVDQICYALLATGSNTLAISVTRSGTTEDGTFQTLDFVGSATSSVLDTSTGPTGTDGTKTSPLTICSACFTPAASGEIVLASAGWDNCTATAANAPTGALFHSAVQTSNGVDGPQSADQNNGWLMYRTTSSSAISVGWTMNCTGTVGTDIGNWSGTIAGFKPSSGGGGCSTPTLAIMGAGCK